MNGKTWPYLDVPNKRQRFFLINGSNARSYILSFKNNPPPNIPALASYTPAYTNSVEPTIWQIGTDQGYLDTPVAVDYLRIMPGERAEFIIDFGTAAVGDSLVLHNFGPDAPLSDITATSSNDPNTTGSIMQFKVVAGAADTGYDPSSGAAIRTGGQEIVRLVDPAAGTLAAGVTVSKTRALTLNEIARDVLAPFQAAGNTWGGGPLEILVNNSKWNGLRPDETMPNMHMSPPLATVNGGQPDGLMNWLTELPVEGTTEIWEIINLTADAHPIHTHLAQFQLMNRQQFQGDLSTMSGGYYDAYMMAFPGGSFIPAYGQPLPYDGSNSLSGVDSFGNAKLGGNPDVSNLLVGNPIPPDLNEAGWKDTVFVPPGFVTRFVVRWGPQHFPITTPANQIKYAFVPDGPVQSKAWPNGMYDYVWHCHIVDHEDNEMMRPDAVYIAPEVFIDSAVIPVNTDTLTGAGHFRTSGAPPWSATIDFGDGSPVQPLSLNGLNFTFMHEYADAAGSYLVTVTVFDNAGGQGSATVQVSVTAMTVPIDFNPTTFNPKAKGTFKITIYSSDGFDVGTIDQSTLKFGPVPFMAGISPDRVQIAGNKMMVFFDRPANLVAGTTSASIWGETNADVLFVGTRPISVISR